MEPSEKGTLVYPSLQGATNWASPSFNPQTGLLYVAVREMGSIYFKSEVEYRPGAYYTGGSEKTLNDEAWGSVRALDVENRFPTIAGAPPDLRHPPAGCRFAARCTHRMEVCSRPPPLLTTTAGGQVACWLEETEP